MKLENSIGFPTSTRSSIYSIRCSSVMSILSSTLQVTKENIFFIYHRVLFEIIGLTIKFEAFCIIIVIICMYC